MGPGNAFRGVRADTADRDAGRHRQPGNPRGLGLYFMPVSGMTPAECPQEGAPPQTEGKAPV